MAGDNGLKNRPVWVRVPPVLPLGLTVQKHSCRLISMKPSKQYNVQLANLHLDNWATKHDAEVIDGSNWDEDRPGILSCVVTLSNGEEHTSAVVNFDTNLEELSVDY